MRKKTRPLVGTKIYYRGAGENHKKDAKGGTFSPYRGEKERKFGKSCFGEPSKDQGPKGVRKKRGRGESHRDVKGRTSGPTKTTGTKSGTEEE